MTTTTMAESYVVLDGDEHRQGGKSAPKGAVAGSYAHNWSTAATAGGIYLHGRHFVDGSGRVCLLRGVNLSGSCKSPANYDFQNLHDGHREVTFVGRPFPLHEAHEHFARLRRWGLTFVRFLITWEAIEHAGPGNIDYEYLDYVRAVLSILPEYNMRCFVSMHQDVWSRFSGGSGAPAWTLEVAGFDLESLEETGAAWLLGVKGAELKERGIWPTGYQKLAASTMSTCFWGGDMFAPKLLVEGIPIQQFLQGRFLACWKAVAERLGDLEGILGFDMLNEPHRGYIDVYSLHNFDYNTDLHLSDIPSAFQSFLLGAGHPTAVQHWVRSFPMPTKLDKHVMLNRRGISAWRKDGPTDGRCLWEMHGVWDYDEELKLAMPLRENYFKRCPESGREIDWYKDFYYPFLEKWTKTVRSACSKPKIIFVEPIPNEFCPASWTAEHQIPDMVFSPHWYDLNALFAKEFGNFSVNVQGISRGMFPLKAFYWGHDSNRANYSLQIRNLVEAGYRSLGEKPVFLGETGVPMDLNNATAFKDNDFTWQARMMDALMCALERNLIGFTLWNYNPDNDDVHGDYWNGENFSWFSRSRARRSHGVHSLDQSDETLDDGGRILHSVVRPYPAKVAGIPLKFHYEIHTGVLTFEWAEPIVKEGQGKDKSSSKPVLATVGNPPLDAHPPLLSRVTEIFIPHAISRGRKLIVELGGNGKEASWRHDEDVQTLYINQPAAEGVKGGEKYSVVVKVDPPLGQRWPMRTHWEDFLAHYLGALAVLTVILGLILK